MASALTSSMPFSVVVWEWLEGRSQWRPYEPSVVEYIEKNHTTSSLIHLGNSDPNLRLYSIDTINQCQIRHDTGSKRTVRRQTYSSDSPAAKGVTWQWLADYPNSWQPYDMDIACTIEDAYSKKLNIIDLSSTRHQLPYTINLINMSQTRNETHRVRPIQRVALSHPYPLDTTSSNTPFSHFMGTETPIYPYNHQVNLSQVSLNFPMNLSNISAVTASLPLTSTTSLTSHASTSFMPPLSSSSSVSSSSSSSASSSVSARIQSGKHSRSADSSPEQDTDNSGRSAHHKKRVMTRHAVRTAALGSSAPHLSHALTSSHAPMSSTQANVGSAGLANGFASASISSSAVGSMNLTQHSAQTGYGSGSRMLLTSNPAHSFGMLNPVVSGMTNVIVSPLVPVIVGSTQTAQTQYRPDLTSSSGSQLKPIRGKRSNHAERKSHKKASKKSAKAVKKEPSTDDILQRYVTVVQDPAKDEDCCICCEGLQAASGYDEECSVVYKLNICAHMFHRSCLTAMYDSGNKDGGLQCPTCKVIYGQKFGNCPPGVMQYESMPDSLPGHPDCGSLKIIYSVDPGVQGPEHPHPGKRYNVYGFPRYCFLPDNERGRKVLRLLIVAWERRLTFTVGNSVTTGARDTVVWNEIHHKTEFGSNYSGHGYPDDNYLDNVLMELSLQGVTDADDDGKL